MRIHRIVVAGLLALAAVGCAAPPEPAVPGVSEQVRALHLPFDEYELSQVDHLTIAYAKDVLIRDCMRAKGVDWTMPPAPPEQDPDPLVRRRYGLIEADIAARYGYHRPPEAERRVADDVDGTGSCAAEAGDRLPGVADDRLYQYTLEAFAAARKDPATVRTFREWRTCMRSGGADYPDPLSAIGDPAWQTEHPSAREISVAKLDVRCKQRTNLVDTWSAAEVRRQDLTIRSHPDDFARFAHIKRIQLDAAHQVIESQR